MYRFLIPKIFPVLGSFFRADNNITGGSNRVGSKRAGGSNRVGVVGGRVVLIYGYKMKQEDDWNPEAKFGLSMTVHGPQITPN